MNFSTEQSRSFFGPLVGKTTTFLLEGRGPNLEFARTTLGLIAATGSNCAILDLDALYASNADYVLSSLGKGAHTSVLKVPSPGLPVEDDLSELFSSHQDVIIVDSLNSLYHLLAAEDGSSRGRKTTFTLAGLSYFARTNSKVVLLSMYRREGLPKTGSARPISGLSDVTASVQSDGEALVVRTIRGSAWPGGSLSIRIPSV